MVRTPNSHRVLLATSILTTGAMSSAYLSRHRVSKESCCPQIISSVNPRLFSRPFFPNADEAIDGVVHKPRRLGTPRGLLRRKVRGKDGRRIASHCVLGTRLVVRFRMTFDLNFLVNGFPKHAAGKNPLLVFPPSYTSDYPIVSSGSLLTQKY